MHALHVYGCMSTFICFVFYISFCWESGWVHVSLTCIWWSKANPQESVLSSNYEYFRNWIQVIRLFRESTVPQKPPQWTEYVHLCRINTLTQQSVWNGENRKHLGNQHNAPREKLHSWPYVLGPRQDMHMLKNILYKITLCVGRWFKG